jgi:hypothetical protein
VPPHLAACAGSRTLVELLLFLGADPTIAADELADELERA